MTLHEEVQDGDGGRHEERHRDLVGNEVAHRVEPGVLRREVGVPRCRTEIKAPGGCNERCRRVHRDEEKHREARGARDEDVHELTDEIAQGENEIRRIEPGERLREVVRHAGGGADQGHVSGVTGCRHDDEAESGNARTHDGGDALEGVEELEARGRDLVGKELQRAVNETKLRKNDGGEEQNQAARKENELRLEVLEEVADHKDGHEEREYAAGHGFLLNA